MYSVRKKFLQFQASIFCVLLSYPALSQNGKIISQQAFIPADSSLREMERVAPGIGSLAQSPLPGLIWLTGSC